MLIFLRAFFVCTYMHIYIYRLITLSSMANCVFPSMKSHVLSPSICAVVNLPFCALATKKTHCCANNCFPEALVYLVASFLVLATVGLLLSLTRQQEVHSLPESRLSGRCVVNDEALALPLGALRGVAPFLPCRRHCWIAALTDVTTRGAFPARKQVEWPLCCQRRGARIATSGTTSC